LKHFAGSTSLRQLEIINTRVTAEGLEHLEELTNLRVLHLCGSNTQVTDEGFERLKHTLENCAVRRY